MDASKRFHKNKALEIAQSILDGKVHFIEGVRQLLGPLENLGLRKNQDFLIFTGVDSETDHLPLGKHRGSWEPKALKQKDLELKKAEKDYRESIMAACKHLIHVLGEIDC